jgi:hypothetical protein
MANATDSSFYNLFTVNLSQYLEHTKGYIEHQDFSFEVIFEGPGRNVTYEHLSRPDGITLSHTEQGQVYSYKITSVNSNGETTARTVATTNGPSDLTSDPITIE